MTGPIWVFDSSSLIEIKSTPRARRESLFEALARLVVAGRLKFPRQVLRELSKRDDVVKSWAVQQRTAIFDPPTFDQLKLVLNTVPDVIDSRKDTGEDEADPYVLALAVHLRVVGNQDVRIVTQESKDSPDKTSLHTAAGMLGVPSVPLGGFLRIERIS